MSVPDTPASSARWRLWLGATLALLQICFASDRVNAQALGTSSSGLRGLVYTGLPLTEPEFAISAAAGYGSTESFAPVSGMHHRGASSLGVALAPLPWLAFALKVDGRLELHPDDGAGSHSAGFGDPRLFARAGYAVSRDWALGGEIVGWFPGTEAPSIDLAATSLEARALAAFTPANSGWIGLGSLGFRLDNSGHTAPDLSRLRLGDRISLGVSDSNAMLVALGAARRFGASAELFGELSADIEVGSRAPALSESPLRAAIGGRYFTSSALQLDLTAITSLSARPDIGQGSALVPIEPRLLLLLGVRYSAPLSPKRATRLETTHEDAAPPVAAKPKAPQGPQSTELRGALVDERGEPLPEATVKLRVQGGELREAITDAEGHYAFQAVPLGPAGLEVSATGFQTQSWDIDVQLDMPAEAARALVPKTDSGVLRGLIRSFQSEPLQAAIVVRDRRGRVVVTRESAEDGHFDIDLPPGSYEVTITSRGYRPHRRNVQISGNGVSILNVDMREER